MPQFYHSASIVKHFCFLSSQNLTFFSGALKFHKILPESLRTLVSEISLDKRTDLFSNCGMSAPEGKHFFSSVSDFLD